MNLRNRKLVITVRTLLGLFMVFSGITGWMAGADMHNVPAPMVESSKLLWDVGIFQLIKTVEIIAGLLLVTGFLPALGAVMLVPILVGVLVYNAHVAPQYVVTGVVVSLLVAYLGYAYWDKYKVLFEQR